MKRIYLKSLFAVLICSLLLLSACEKKGDATPPASGSTNSLIGQPAPDISLKDMQGNTVTLSQFKGKVVVLNFWATWCPPCREEMPSMERLHQQFKDQGLVLLAVNVEQDGARVKAYGVFRFPESFIIDRNGVIVDKIIGGRDWMRGATFDFLKFQLQG